MYLKKAPFSCYYDLGVLFNYHEMFVVLLVVEFIVFSYSITQQIPLLAPKYVYVLTFIRFAANSQLKVTCN